jgi:hypothetical protein
MSDIPSKLLLNHLNLLIALDRSLPICNLTPVNALHEASTAVPSCSRMIPAEHLKYSHRIISHRLSGQILNEFKIA